MVGLKLEYPNKIGWPSRPLGSSEAEVPKMIRLSVAVIVGLAVIAPAMAQQKMPKDTVLVADSGRSYSGRSIERDSDESSSKASAKSSSKTASKPSPQPNPVTDPVENAVKAGKDVLSIFGR